MLTDIHKFGKTAWGQRKLISDLRDELDELGEYMKRLQDENKSLAGQLDQLQSSNEVRDQAQALQEEEDGERAALAREE